MVEKDTRVVMLHVSGRDTEVQWFDYRPGFFSEIIRIEWESDTMEAVLPSDIAAFLVSRGHAKLAEDKS